MPVTNKIAKLEKQVDALISAGEKLMRIVTPKDDNGDWEYIDNWNKLVKEIKEDNKEE